MARLDEERIKKLKTGEKIALAATLFCGAMLAAFIALFVCGEVLKKDALIIAALAGCIPLIVVGAAAGAFFNVKFGGAMDKLIKDYVRDVFIENAALMHPERNSLTFYVFLEGSSLGITVNGYKERILFDLSPFGKLSMGRKLSVLNAIESRLCVTFCRLYDNGANYAEVSYTEREGTRRRTKKPVPIIVNGQPDRKSYKIYLKNR